MKESFEERWRQIQRLTPGQKFENWSILGRARGSFEIASIGKDAVIVKSDGISGERRVPKVYFAKVFEVWDSYRGGVIPRVRITQITHNSTYILSILHLTE